MAIIEVNEANFNETIEAAFEKHQTVILKFGSELCDACMVQGFELEELDELLKELLILEIDLSESEALSYEFDITEVPTTIIFKNRDTILLREKGIILATDMQKIIKEA